MHDYDIWHWSEDDTLAPTTLSVKASSLDGAEDTFKAYAKVHYANLDIHYHVYPKYKPRIGRLAALVLH